MLRQDRRLRVNVMIGDQRTSISIEPEAWDALLEIAQRRELPIHEVISELEAVRGNISRVSAIRVHILEFYRDRASGTAVSI